MGDTSKDISTENDVDKGSGSPLFNVGDSVWAMCDATKTWEEATISKVCDADKYLINWKTPGDGRTQSDHPRAAYQIRSMTQGAKLNIFAMRRKWCGLEPF